MLGLRGRLLKPELSTVLNRRGGYLVLVLLTGCLFLELFEILERGVLFSRLFGGDLLLDLCVQCHLILHWSGRQVAGRVLFAG